MNIEKTSRIFSLATQCLATVGYFVGAITHNSYMITLSTPLFCLAILTRMK